MRAFVRFVVIAVVVAAFWSVMPSSADAQSFTAVRPGGRGGTWDFYLPLTYADSARISGQNGSSVDLDPAFGFGFGFGYNISEHFHVNGLFTWNSRSYDALVTGNTGTGAPSQRYNNIAYTSTFMLSGIFYLLEGNVTPFVSGGVGITYVDTNIQNGPSSGACWWDPWWGYVCSSYVPTKTENDVSYSAGLGLRIDLSRQFGMQGSYNKTWIDYGKASSTPTFDTWRLDLLFRM